MIQRNSLHADSSQFWWSKLRKPIPSWLIIERIFTFDSFIYDNLIKNKSMKAWRNILLS